MNTDVLRRFRDGVAAKRFTLTKLAEVADIPLATLSDWSDTKREPKFFGQLAKLERGLDELEGESGPTEPKTENEQGRQTSAA